MCWPPQEGRRASAADEVSSLEREVDRLRRAEAEAMSLRNAATAMGMALEAEQEARKEAERELHAEHAERSALQEQLAASNAESEVTQVEIVRRMKSQVDDAKGKLRGEQTARQKAEKELYRSAVAITDYRQLQRRLEEANERCGNLARELELEVERRKKLEKVMYRSSVVMFQQVDKRMATEHAARHDLEHELHDEREARRRADAARARAEKELEVGSSAAALHERSARQHLEKVAYKSSMGVYRQLEERIERENTLKAELGEERERSRRLEHELAAESDVRRRLEAQRTRVTKDLDHERTSKRRVQNDAVRELGARGDALDHRTEQWRRDEAALRKELERERQARKRAEVEAARKGHEAEILRARTLGMQARARAARENGSSAAGQQAAASAK